MADQPLPIVPYLKLPESGDPYLEGFQCGQCKAIALKRRMACARCGARDSIEPHRLADKGELHAFSIIHRSFPGIDVPFVSAIADLDGGGTIKTNLVGVEPDPAKVKTGMRVELCYEIAPRKDAEGNEYMTFYLRPESH